MTTPHYRADIDGLRALAVIPVVGFHLEVPWMRAGYLGVDLFFVLSGFLITGILLRECRQGRFSYRHFIARRIRRIGPVLIAVVAATIGATLALVASYRHQFAGEQAIAALVSLSNLYYWNRVGDYWGPTANESVLLHCWSLAIEEQFYLFFPWVIRWGHRLAIDRLLAVVGFATLGSLGVYLFKMQDSPQDAFYWLPCRAWQLLAGAFAAIWLSGYQDKVADLERLKPRIATAIPILGLLFILVAYVISPSTSPDAIRVNDGLFSLGTLNFGPIAVVLGTVLLTSFPVRGVTRRLLASRPMTYVGQISYSIYMWHWPILVYASQLHIEDSIGLQLTCIATTSVVSFHVIEARTRYRANVIPWICVAFVVVLAGAIGLALSNRPTTSNSSTNPRATLGDFASPVWYGGEYNLLPTGEPDYWQRLLDSSGVIAPPRTASPEAYRTEGVYVGSSDPPEIVLLGDSHAAMYAHEIRQIAVRLKRPLTIWTVNGSSPFFSIPPSDVNEARVMSKAEKFEYDSARIKQLAIWKPDVVIVAARWSLWKNENWEPCLDYLCRNSGRVLLLGPIPETDQPDRMVVERLTALDIHAHAGQPNYFEANEPSRTREMIRRVSRLADRFGNCDFVELHDLYGNGDNVMVSLGKEIVYLDDDHLTNFGAQLAMDRIGQAIPLDR